MRKALWLSLVFFAGCAQHQVLLSEQAPATWSMEPGGYEKAVVDRVVDGDTLEVVITGRVAGPALGEAVIGETYVVRLIGIDTPESVDPNRPIECWGSEASQAMSALLQDQSVRLVRDVEETDSFDRLLRYVYIGAEMANARLVANGYAAAYAYPPNNRHSDLFVQLQRAARENDRGLWSSETCDGGE
jgi:micrococcal nuclease